MAKNKRTARIDAWLRRHTDSHECACGCGFLIDIKRTHYRTGVPKFIKGHNFQSVYNPQTEEEAPEIPTYWNTLSEKEKARRLSYLKNFGTGENHPNWKGGIKLSDHGYRLVRLTEHPFAVGGYVAQHRLVVESWIRENAPEHEYMVKVDGEVFLKRGVVVHHMNEVKTFNEISNLVVLDSQSVHLSWHMKKCTDNEKFEFFRGKFFCPWLDK